MAYTSEIEKLERRVQENPQGRFFASLADAYRKDGQVSRALEVLKTGLMIHPDYVSARVVLGRCLLDQGDDAGAEAAFTRVTELDGESVIALKALADISERRGDFAASARWAGALLTVDPGSDEAREQLTRVEQQAGASAAPTAAPELEAVSSEFQGLIAAATDEPAFEPAAEEAGGAMPEPVPEFTPPPRRDSIRFEPSADPTARTLEFTPPEVEPMPPARRLSGIETTAVESDRDEAGPAAEPLAVEGFESGTPQASTGAAPAGALEGLEATGLGSDEAIERESEIEIRSGPSNEFQQPDDGSDLTAGGTASEFQEPSATDTLSPAAGRRSGAAPTFDPVAEAEEVPPPGLPEPEPVVTEAMALLYVSQGLTGEALAVYRELLERSPGDTRYAEQVRMLEGALPAVDRPAWLAAETGGVAVGEWLRSVLAARLPEVALPETAATTPSAPRGPEPGAASSADDAPRSGTPTRPAPDHLSLGSIFGDEPAAPPAEGPPAGSFDDFFGGNDGADAGAVTPRTRTIRHTQADDDDLGQFQDWLKNLKQ
jgi:tetratricopeptide (TPR) repeat protein